MTSMAKNLCGFNPYFIPDESVQEALSIAALSEWMFALWIPSKPDHPIVYRAMNFLRFLKFIQSGVKVYVYQMDLHAKQ